MRSTLVAAATLLLAPMRAGAQHAAVAGRVVDGETGLPLAGASVVVPAADRRARTDAAGRFAFFRLTPGEETVLFETVGRTSREVSLSLAPDRVVWMEVALAPTGFGSAARVVRETALRPWLASKGFPLRRARGLGLRFLTGDELRAAGGRGVEGAPSWSATVEVRPAAVREIEVTVGVGDAVGPPE